MRHSVSYPRHGVGAAYEGTPGGNFPINPNGGRLPFAHPGVLDAFSVVEAVRQLRGGAGKRHVPGAARALVHGCGGVLLSHATAVLGAQEG